MRGYQNQRYHDQPHWQRGTKDQTPPPVSPLTRCPYNNLLTSSPRSHTWFVIFPVSVYKSALSSRRVWKPKQQWPTRCIKSRVLTPPFRHCRHLRRRCCSHNNLGRLLRYGILIDPRRFGNVAQFQVCLWTYLWVSPSLSSYNLSLPSCWYGQFLVIVYFLGYSWCYPRGD